MSRSVQIIPTSSVTFQQSNQPRSISMSARIHSNAIEPFQGHLIMLSGYGLHESVKLNSLVILYF